MIILIQIIGSALPPLIDQLAAAHEAADQGSGPGS